LYFHTTYWRVLIDLISKNYIVLSMKFIDTLRQALIDEVVGVQVSRGEHFEEDNPPEVEIDTKKVGHWIWISTRADYEGASWNPSTDRLKGDPYSAHVFNNWIGEAKSAPRKVSHLDELDSWALLHTEYEREYTDVGSWGVHKGRWIESFSSDGIVTLRIHSNWRFQDVHPETETTSEQFEINRFRVISPPSKNASVIPTQPMDALSSKLGECPSPTMNSVLPPPMSITNRRPIGAMS